MKTRRKLSAVVLSAVLVLVFSLSGCNKGYAGFELDKDETVTAGTAGTNANGGGSDTQKPTGQSPTAQNPTSGGNTGNTARQMTEESIQKMNNGNAAFVYSDAGYLTFLKGRYSDKKIMGWEDAVASLDGMAQLLGITSGTDWLVTYGESDGRGYTYWVLQQRYAGVTVAYGTVRIIVDPQGYTAGLSSSIVPELGIATNVNKITPQEAEKVVRDHMSANYGRISYEIYSEYTTESLYTNYDDQTYQVYCIYTSNPFSNEHTVDMPFVEHLVTVDGEYLDLIFSHSATSSRDTSIDTNTYFEGLEPSTWSGIVTWADGSMYQVTIPVAYNPADGMYYMADVERKIIMADYFSFRNNSSLQFTTCANNQWEDYKILQMYNYCRAYDFYANYGIKSPDGLGTPILILTDWSGVGADGQELVNAFSLGLFKGWMAFAGGAAGHLEQGADAIVHEYTHSVTGTALCKCLYANETGAINESYSDIMGELFEQIMGEGDDAWTIGQRSTPLRSMSNPNEYEQPGFVGDLYFSPRASNPSSDNDNGGVHGNSSLLNRVAYNFNQDGITLSDQVRMWLTTTSLLTPRNSYDEVYLALLMSIEINGLDENYKNIVYDEFNKVGLLGDREERARTVFGQGCAKVVLPIAESLIETIVQIEALEYNASTDQYVDTMYRQYVGRNGKIELQLPAGTYAFAVWYKSTPKNKAYVLQKNGNWSTQFGTPYKIQLEAGKEYTLPDLN